MSCRNTRISASREKVTCLLIVNDFGYIYHLDKNIFYRQFVSIAGEDHEGALW